MDRLALVGWLALGLLLGAGAWVAQQVAGGLARWINWPTDGLEKLLLSGLVLGGVTAWVCRHDARRPPLPAEGLATVSSPVRAIARAAVRATVALVCVTVVMSAQQLPFTRPLGEVLSTAAMGAGAVMAAALVEHALLGRAGRRGLLPSLALTALAALGGVLVAGAHVVWWRSGREGLWRLAASWGELPHGVAQIGLPLALVLAAATGARLTNLRAYGVGLVAAVATPIAMLVVVLVMKKAWLVEACELTAVALALPLAVRVGDLVGPGWRRDDAAP